MIEETPSLFKILTNSEGLDYQFADWFENLFRGMQLPLLPEEITIADGQTILEVACKDGEWVHELAFHLNRSEEHENVIVVGVDFRPRYIGIARAKAKDRGYENVVFLLRDLYHMNLSANSYDLVHLRGLAPLVPAERWPQLLAEVVRLLRPGGHVVCTELAWPTTNAPIGETAANLVRQVLHIAAYTPIQIKHLGELFRDAGCQRVRQRTTTLELLTVTGGNLFLQYHLLPMMYLLAPFLKKHGLASDEQFKKLQYEIESAAVTATFRANWSAVTTIGEKLTLDEVTHTRSERNSLTQRRTMISLKQPQLQLLAKRSNCLKGFAS
ncbi:MAG: class I SAM-dependent methyltransferase [Chloroflexi bacterium]|nr:class I SAM-dependent methyltransferase [Ktedonobacteraceae bacterium]MBV9707317.1 class I SAM-dependent methyltransferase [Chloroflexota bacterium]